MDGWMDRWINGWMEMGRWMIDGWIHQKTLEQMRSILITDRNKIAGSWMEGIVVRYNNPYIFSFDL